MADRGKFEFFLKDNVVHSYTNKLVPIDTCIIIFSSNFYNCWSDKTAWTVYQVARMPINNSLYIPIYERKNKHGCEAI
jgi:hypothetical protein